MFDRKMLLIKERVGFLKFADTFDIYDPITGAQIGIAREKISFLMKVLRLLINKRLLPTSVEVRERDDAPVLITLRRGSRCCMPTWRFAMHRRSRSVPSGARPSRWAAVSTCWIPRSSRLPRSKETGKAGISGSSRPMGASWAKSPRSGRESEKSCSPRPTTTSLR